MCARLIGFTCDEQDALFAVMMKQLLAFIELMTQQL